MVNITQLQARNEDSITINLDIAEALRQDVLLLIILITVVSQLMERLQLTEMKNEEQRSGVKWDKGRRELLFSLEHPLKLQKVKQSLGTNWVSVPNSS